MIAGYRESILDACQSRLGLGFWTRDWLGDQQLQKKGSFGLDFLAAEFRMLSRRPIDRY